MKCVAAVGVSVLLLTTAPLLAETADEAHAWLERMSAAMSQMSYQGTFVYVQGDQFETMRITHVVDDGVQRERLVSISGEAREVLRDASGVRWFSGDEPGALADPAVNRPIFFELPLEDVARASDSYDFKVQTAGRVAGHATRRLDILPRDGFRYGYRLWLEQQSGLLLHWQLHNLEGETLARLLFTDVRMGSAVDRRELNSSRGGRAPEVRATALPAEVRAMHRVPAWAPDKLPPGFRLASHRAPDEGASEHFEHLVYSDGIAAVSVYIESLGDKPHRTQGVSTMGTTHAYFGAVNGMFVTVVGDVPESTVKLIGEAVHPVEP